MTPNEFRRLALSLPEATEGSHMDHPDFRVGGKIFATLGPAGTDWGMVKLTPAEQADLAREDPAVFEPFPGAWGRRGCTRIYLPAARAPTLRPVLKNAWRHTAPERLVARHER